MSETITAVQLFDSDIHIDISEYFNLLPKLVEIDLMVKTFSLNSPMVHSQLEIITIQGRATSAVNLGFFPKSLSQVVLSEEDRQFDLECFYEPVDGCGFDNLEVLELFHAKIASLPVLAKLEEFTVYPKDIASIYVLYDILEHSKNLKKGPCKPFDWYRLTNTVRVDLH
jgi:hypothetical protein